MWWSEGEEEQIWECGRSDSVWERLRNQPIHSPPSSPSSGKVFLICPQLYFSQPPPLTSQLHFSPPPTTSDLMPPYLDFSPRRSPPPQIFPIYPDCENDFQFEFDNVASMIALLALTCIPATQEVAEVMRLLCHSSKPLTRNLEDNLRDLGSAYEAAVKDLNKAHFALLKLVNKAVSESALVSVLNPLITTIHEIRLAQKAIEDRILLGDKILLGLQIFIGIFPTPRLIGEIRQCHSSKPLKGIIEDSLRDFGGTRDAARQYFNTLLWWLPLELITDRLVAKPKSCEELFEEMAQKCFLPPKSTKMVSIWSCLSVVKISRKISIRLLQLLPSVQLPQTLQIVIVEEKMTQSLSCSGEFISQERKKERLMEIISPSMHEKHDSRLRCIQTPLHARSSPQTIALLDGGEMVQLDSSKQQSLVEFDITNNSAHLVRASQSCSTVSHSDETNSRETLKRKCTTESVLSFEDLRQHFGCKRDNAAKALGVSLSTVKRTCRLHGIPRWPSRKKKKVSKTDCILLEPRGEKDVSPTCSKMPTDGQTERVNEMVGHLQDQNEDPNLSNTENGSNEESITTLIFQDSVPVSEMDYILVEPEGEKNVSPTCKTPTVGTVLDFIEGPNLSNTKNRSNKESITTPTFQDSVPVFEIDCILLEPQGEKNVPPTHKTSTNGQTMVGNGMVGHIQDQNGIVPEFIEGPNLSNTENRSNEKSLTTPNFQDSVPGNYPAMDFSISSTYRESGKAGGSSELAFQPKELTPSTAYPNPNACVFTQPHVSLREMLIENVGSSIDSRNFSTSALGFFMGGHVSESSCTTPLCSDQAPMQTITTIPHIMPHLTEKQDVRTVTFKAQYREKNIKFRLSLPSGIVELKKQVTNRLGELGSFQVHYHDNDNDWILIGCDTDLWDCFELSSTSGNEVVRLVVLD